MSKMASRDGSLCTFHTAIIVEKKIYAKSVSTRENYDVVFFLYSVASLPQVVGETPL